MIGLRRRLRDGTDRVRTESAGHSRNALGARRALLVALAPLLGACAAVHRPAATVASLERDAVAARAVEEATTDSIVERLARRAVARGDRTVDILLLSGGGQNGAYGAGFLRGWKSRSDAPMPTFDLVTGVSTGALQAPFVFLGTDAALDTLAALYRRSAETIAPTIDWLFWLRRTGGLVKTDRLRRTIAQVMDSTMQGALQAGFREGRQLAISTTDFDLAVARTWDLAQELSPGVSALPRLHQLLVTSSSLPGVLPSQVIDGRVHLDGGITGNLLPILTRPQVSRLAAAVRSLGVQEPLTVRLWVIMNLWTQAPVAVMNPASRRAINSRTLLLLFWAQHPLLLPRLAELADGVSAATDGVRMEMHFTAIPAAVANDPAAFKLFDRDFMQRLEQMGYARARSATPWEAALPSPYVRPR
ncbi:MAG: patatin-like phospholipase family protein [Gemmatimonadetes bacterium]|nr:patatin-like phospholipase family protein [Gemmatimonadota bacterium]